MKNRLSRGGLGIWMIAILLACLFSKSAPGQDLAPALANDPEALHRRIIALEAEFQSLKAQQDELNAVLPLPQVHAQDVSYSSTNAEANLNSEANLNAAACPNCGVCNCQNCKAGGGGLPGFPTAKITGFFQADSGFFVQDPTSIATVGDIQNGSAFRRARLAAVGKAYENVDYIVEMDFAFPGRPSFMDVDFAIHDLPLVQNFKVGQWRQPFGMDAMTSVKELTFLERALPFAFVPLRQIGVGVYGTSQSENATYAISGFRFPTDQWGSNVSDLGGFGTAARFTALPIYENDGYSLLHVGAAYSYINPGNDAVQYRNQPEFFVGETGGAALVPVGVPDQVPFFVDTGSIPTQHTQLFGAELGAGYGSIYAQSELMFARVNRLGGGQPYNFNGGYVQVGYFLTGEVRPYNKQAGVFGRVKPLYNFHMCEGWGAWEVAGRASYINLNDQNIRGGILTDYTFGLNWYLNPNTKFQFNYIRADLNNFVFGDSKTDIFALRAQVDF